MEAMIDPYEAFELWMSQNGFEDVVNCEPHNVDLHRLHEAFAVYGNGGQIASNGISPIHKSDERNRRILHAR